MTVTLYHFPKSAPSRGALMAARTIGINVDVQIVDLIKKEQLNEDFIKINPQHCVPTLVDGDLTIWDSHAISCYLATAYAKDDCLYPEDPKKRAVVNQRLYFDCGVFYPRIRAICFPVLYMGEDKIFDEQRGPLDEALGFLNIFLEGNNFACGNKLTIADCSLVASVASIIAIGWDISPYSNIAAWFARCASAIPGFQEVNQKGADELGREFKSKLAPGQL